MWSTGHECFDAGELAELWIACGINERHHKMAKRMVKVALLCVQYRPYWRPIMAERMVTFFYNIS